MSQSEVERFARDLQASSALKDEFSRNGSAETLVSLAQRHGYRFAADDLKAFAQARATAAGRKLTADELDAIAGSGASGSGQSPIREILPF